LDNTGYFLFSLDTELAWGMFDHFRTGFLSEDGGRERRSIARLLDILDEFNIKATWAVVGHLLYEKCEECSYCPILEWRGKYPVFESIYQNNHPLWYGADIIDDILSRKTAHEIALHGYTHKTLDTMTGDEVLIEINESLPLFVRRGIIPCTIVFPRNRIAHLELFDRCGFVCYRGEELFPKTHSLPFVGMAFRRYHRYIAALSVPIVYDCEVDPSGLVNLPSSRWFFGFNRNIERILDGLNLHLVRIHKMVEGIAKAASERKIIHIWAHPCEFQTNKDFDKLRFLFEGVSSQVSKGSLESVGMAELAKRFHKVK
jgi:hypothetical protein